MSYKLERLSDLPVLLLNYKEGVVFADGMEAINDAAFDILEAESSPITFMIDTEYLSLSFNDIMAGIQLSTRSKKPSFTHPNVKQLVIISQSKTIATVVKGLNTVSFGNLNAVVFEQLEDALSYVRMNAA